MYPLPEGMFAPRNQWYVAAWSHEVSRDPIERWILNEPIALYRTQDGKAIALDGRCPHRHFPLGKSGVVGDNIECGYHGIQFGPDGRTKLVPSQAGTPSACDVKAFALAERSGFIWIWPGDTDSADLSLLPDLEDFHYDNEGFEVCGEKYNSVPGRYMLMHDNLFDLTHLAVLHRNSIAGGDFGSVKEVREEGDNWLSNAREFKDIEMPPYFLPVTDYRGLLDRKMLQQVSFAEPASVL